jgi:adenosylmethionine-8-amino-7-oxononanoate aminotransferase
MGSYPALSHVENNPGAAVESNPQSNSLFKQAAGNACGCPAFGSGRQIVELLKIMSAVHKKYLAGSPVSIPIQVSDAVGSFVTDRSGKRYIDLVMGWCVGNLGWTNKEIKAAIRKYDGPGYVYPGFINERWEILAQMLAEIAPGNLNRCFRATGGSEAVDAALQIAMAVTGRHKFVSLENSYHGNTIATLSIGAYENREKLDGLLPGCSRIDIPLDEKAAEKLETRLKKKDVAAFIMEPVCCNLGVHIPSAGFMKEARKLCSKYGTLMILDEVASGFGRTGKLFATGYFDITPDILTLGKSVTNGFSGLGAVITTQQIARAAEDKVQIYSTYGWHPLGVEAAIATIKYYQDHNATIFDNVAACSQLMRTHLSQMNFKKKGTLNIIGLAVGVNVGDAKYAEAIRQRCFKKGLLITSQEEHLVMFPALTIGKRTLKRAMDILGECV